MDDELAALVEAHELAAHFQRHGLVTVVLKRLLHFPFPVAEFLALFIAQVGHELARSLLRRWCQVSHESPVAGTPHA